MLTKVGKTYLEMTSPQQLVPSVKEDKTIEIVKQQVADPMLNRDLYVAVGSSWYWIDRLPWTDDDWAAWVDQPGLDTWVMCVSGDKAGYFELNSEPDGSVEVAYFGLLPEFIGRGLGGHLLTLAVQEAWRKGASRVWLNTCTLDHPGALPNYKARGFRVHKEETYEVDL